MYQNSIEEINQNNSKSTRIASVMMIKNESERLSVSLESLKQWIDSYIFYDTGSTDGTQDIIRNWCSNNKKEFHILEGQFIDFSTSRNVLLDYADSFQNDSNLLLDYNDELKTGKELRKFCDTYSANASGFLIKQMWFCGGSTQSYLNVRLIKPRHNWRYKGAVHEFILSPEASIIRTPRIDQIMLYQDRTMDENKSFSRFSRDRSILFKEYKHDPTDSRTVFYLAQTLACLGQFDSSYKYYKIRSKMGGFPEEVFHSLMKCGDLSR